MEDVSHSMPKELAELFDPLKNQIITLHVKWKITEQLFAHSDERINLLSRTAPSFFRIISFVLRDDIFVTISRITDPATRMSLNRMMKMLNNHVHPSLYSELSARMSDINDQVDPIKEWRNRKIAHLELQDPRKGPEPLPEITKKSIENVLLSMRKIMNEIEIHFEDTETIYDQVLLRGDGETIAFILSSYLESRSSRFVS